MIHTSPSPTQQARPRGDERSPQGRSAAGGRLSPPSVPAPSLLITILSGGERVHGSAPSMSRRVLLEGRHPDRLSRQTHRWRNTAHNQGESSGGPLARREGQRDPAAGSAAGGGVSPIGERHDHRPVRATDTGGSHRGSSSVARGHQRSTPRAGSPSVRGEAVRRRRTERV